MQLHKIFHPSVDIENPRILFQIICQLANPLIPASKSITSLGSLRPHLLGTLLVVPGQASAALVEVVDERLAETGVVFVPTLHVRFEHFHEGQRLHLRKRIELSTERHASNSTSTHTLPPLRCPLGGCGTLRDSWPPRMPHRLHTYSRIPEPGSCSARSECAPCFPCTSSAPRLSCSTSAKVIWSGLQCIIK